jgi:hypothetical protein
MRKSAKEAGEEAAAWIVFVFWLFGAPLFILSLERMVP